MLNFSNKNVLWIFSHPKPQTIPSYLVSGIYPANYLGIQKVIFLENHDPKELLQKFKPKCLIISKVFNNNINHLIKEAKVRDIKVISIFDDWVFPNDMRKKINLPIAKNSDIVIAKTAAAADHITENTKIKCSIIPDPIRFKTYKIFKEVKNPINVCWFGMDTNHDSILNELKNLDNLKIKIKLTIISNYINSLKTKIDSIKIENLIIEYFEWNNSSNKNIVQSEVVILPYPNDKTRLVKSSNRIVDSLNLGRFTILSNVSQFSEFENYTYFGKISDGLSWLLHNKDEAIQKTKLGQEYVLENFSLKAICNKWLDIIKY